MKKAAAPLASAVVCFAALLFSSEAHAFEYLEHAYFTDRACQEVQDLLAVRLTEQPDDRTLRIRYLALALMCPANRRVDYCAGGTKTSQGHVHLSHRSPDDGGYSITLGDYAALPDHHSQFGPVAGLARAEKRGLTEQTYRWLARPPDRAGGVYNRVARHICQKTDPIPWQEIDDDIASAVASLEKSGVEDVPRRFLSSLTRAPLIQAAVEPAGIYSFANPHYLDLVLRNHHHFGEQAYGTWAGFHSTAIGITEQSCAANFGLNPRATRRLARTLEGRGRLRTRGMSDEELANRGCEILGEHTRLRLLRWAENADPALVAPVQAHIEALSKLAQDGDVVDAVALRLELDSVVSALTSLIFEAGGLHFLQDGFAGGHVRTIRTRGGLGEARYDHDSDNRDGVSSILQTRRGQHTFVAFGDSYLLGGGHEAEGPCDWTELNAGAPSGKKISRCLLQHQRRLIAMATAASLLDWALGGTMYDMERPSPDVPLCPEHPREERLICEAMPLAPVQVGGEAAMTSTGTYRLHAGSLPVPPPPFAYQSLVVALGFDVAGSASQLGLQVTLLSELGAFANWLTSYRAGFFVTPGDDELSQFVGEFSYNFHWRWSARFLLDAGPMVFGGLRGFGDKLSFYSGLGPVVGFTALPEGWVKIPLEINISYRLPMTFFSSSTGFIGNSFGIEAHWLQFGVGLAFM